jgi:hypothetical protein
MPLAGQQATLTLAYQPSAGTAQDLFLFSKETSVIALTKEYSLPAATPDLGTPGANSCPLPHHAHVNGSASGDG